MTKKRSTKRALLLSFLSLLMCVSMLIGSTYAWFTDSVTSANNIIKSGTLDVTMEWKDATATGKQQTYKDASEGAIFNYDKWEPGYLEAKNVKIANVGTLALKYQLNIAANGIVSELANVIDVYYADGEYTLADRSMTELKNIGTLADVLANLNSTASGTLEAGKSDTVTIALKMRETAGNEYQGKSIGSDFTVQLLATQLTSESDSFDNQYDANAAFSVWNGVVPAEMPETLVVDTTKHLISINDAQAFAYFNTLINDANFSTNYGSKWKYSVELNADIDLANMAWTPITMSNFVSFDGKGHTIKNLFVDTTAENGGLFESINCNDIGQTYVKNFTISNAYVRSAKRAGVVAGTSPQGLISNVNVEDATVIGTKYVGGIFGGGNGGVINSTVKNSFVIIHEGGEKEAGGLIGYLANDGVVSAENKVISSNTVENVIVSAPTVASALVSQPNSANNGTGVIVIENNTVKNVTVTTADNTADIFVSNNVTPAKTIVRNNNEIDCTVNKAATTLPVVVDDTSAFESAKANGIDVIIADGVVVEGTTQLNTGATIIGATFKNENGTAVTQTVSGTFKDCVFEGSEALRWCYSNAGETVVFENCVIKTDFRGVHFDTMSGNVVFRNCEINGFNAIGGPGTVTFENCTFGNDKSGYNGLNMYSNINLIDCTFNYVSGKTNFIDMEGSGKTLTITNCKAYLDGVETDIANFVGGSKLAQNTVVYN